jgi:hypothetical protein
MSSTLHDFAEAISGLGDDTPAAAVQAPFTRPKANSHIHLPPNFTAFETTSQALTLAREQDVRILGASNYYDYSIYVDFAAQARSRGIFPLFGLEIISLIEPLVQAGVKINDPGNPGKMYICGKGITRFDPMTDEAKSLLQVIRDSDSARMAAITDKLAAVFAAAGVETGLDTEAIKESVAARHGSPLSSVYLQERHIAQAFQEALFDRIPQERRSEVLEHLFGAASKAQAGDAVAVQNEIRSHLMKAGKPAFVPDTFVDFDHAYRLILALGGIPCYPTLADGTDPITDYEQPVERLIADLKDRGVPSAEFIPVRNSPEVLSRYVHALRGAGLFVTAGTEHNTRDLIPLAPTCLGGEPVPDDLQEIFWEGACVVAAHQYLTLTGRPGFVAADGRPNPNYGSDDDRIQGFRHIGERVIARYMQKYG